MMTTRNQPDSQLSQLQDPLPLLSGAPAPARVNQMGREPWVLEQSETTTSNNQQFKALP